MFQTSTPFKGPTTGGEAASVHSRLLGVRHSQFRSDGYRIGRIDLHVNTPCKVFLKLFSNASMPVAPDQSSSFSSKFLIVTLMSSSPSAPACDCAGLPKPRSSKATAAATRAEAGHFTCSMIACSVRIAVSACIRAADLISIGIRLRAKCLGNLALFLLFPPRRPAIAHPIFPARRRAGRQWVHQQP
jgi:hypothetical protein